MKKTIRFSMIKISQYKFAWPCVFITFQFTD